LVFFVFDFVEIVIEVIHFRYIRIFIPDRKEKKYSDK